MIAAFRHKATAHRRGGQRSARHVPAAIGVNQAGNAEDAVPPEHERVIEDLQRELQVGESQFHALLDKRLDASLAKNLAQSESGIAFAVVEPAGLPKEPYSPHRDRLALMGLALGLGLGVAIAFLLEQNDTTFATLDDFQAFTTLL